MGWGRPRGIPGRAGLAGEGEVRARACVLVGGGLHEDISRDSEIRSDIHESYSSALVVMPVRALGLLIEVWLALTLSRS